MAALTELPDDYEEIRHVSFASGWLIFALNLVALAPLILFGGAMFAFWAAYEAVGAPLALALLDRRLLPDWYDILVLIILLLLTLPLHELCHGLAFRRLGAPRVEYGVKITKLVMYARPAGAVYFPRDGFLFATLAPLVAITAGGMLGLMLLPAGARWFFVLAVAFNAAGAIGDMAAVVITLRYPPDVLVRDFGDAFSVYGPVAARLEAR